MAVVNDGTNTRRPVAFALASGVCVAAETLGTAAERTGADCADATPPRAIAVIDLVTTIITSILKRLIRTWPSLHRRPDLRRQSGEPWQAPLLVRFHVAVNLMSRSCASRGCPELPNNAARTTTNPVRDPYMVSAMIKDRRIAMRRRTRWRTGGVVAVTLACIAPITPMLTTSSNASPLSSCPSAPTPSVPSNPAYYAYVNTYDPRCSSQTNWTRSFADTTISTLVDGTVPVSVTTSTALSGAIASLKVAGKEYIASGGHGAALQYTFHAWQADTPSGSECYNPTQAGTRMDDAGQQAPWHAPSTSALYQMSATQNTISTASRPAMFITLADPGTGADPSALSGTCVASTYQSNSSPYTSGLSPYWLTTQVQLGASGLSNVIRLSATLSSQDTIYQHFDGVLIAYLQQDFTANYQVDPATGATTALQSTAASTEPTERCTADGAYCLGVYVRAAAMPTAYYYVMTRDPDAANGMFGEYTSQITVPTSSFGSGSQLNYETYLIVGTRRRVASTIAQLHQLVG